MALSTANSSETNIITKHNDIKGKFGDIQTSYIDIMETNWCTPTSEEYFRALVLELNKAIENLNNNDGVIVASIDNTIEALAQQGTTASLGTKTVDQIDDVAVNWTANPDDPKVTNDVATLTAENFEEHVTAIMNAVADIVSETQTAINEIAAVDAASGQELSSQCASHIAAIESANETLKAALTNYNQTAADTASKADTAYVNVKDQIPTGGATS